MNFAGSPLVRRIGTAATAALLAMVAGNEGRRYFVYRDIAGMPTVCDGVTGPDVIPGKTYTDAECDALLLKQVEAHTAGVLDCLDPDPPPAMAVGLADFGYNVGVNAFCASTAARKYNAGDRIGACAEISRWTWVRHDGHKVDCRTAGNLCPGLVTRRDRERAMCEGRIPIPHLFDGVASGVASTAPRGST